LEHRSGGFGETAVWRGRRLNRIILDDPCIPSQPQGATSRLMNTLAGRAEVLVRSLTRIAVTGVVLMAGAMPATAIAQSGGRPAAATAEAGLPAEPVAPSFDHSAFDGLLRMHVKDGLVDYAAFKGNAAFAGYLTALSKADLKRFEEAERIAFWLNTYNAYTIQLVASHGETESIRNINKTFGLMKLKGPWTEELVRAAGQSLTLDDVEHRILRKEFAEPRIHFAMSLGAKGGPALRSEAYTGERLEEQLEDQTTAFLHDKTRNRADTNMRAVYLSPVIGRYRSDFGESLNELGRFLAEYYPAERAMFLPEKGPDQYLERLRADTANGRKPDTARINSRIRQRRQVWFRIVETPFDWSLNSVRK
jgi:hypothetical protein